MNKEDEGDAARLNEGEPLYRFDAIAASVADEVAYLDASVLPKANGKSLTKNFGRIVEALDAVTGAGADLAPILLQFRDLLRQSFPAAALRQLLNAFPPSLPGEPALRALTFFLVRVIQRSKAPFAAARWLAENIPPPDWAAKLPQPDFPLKAACLCSLRTGGHEKPNSGEKHWATVDRANVFELFRISKEGLKRLTSIAIAEITGLEGGLVGITGANKAIWIIEPIDAAQVSEWTGFNPANPTRPLPPNLFCTPGELPGAVCESLFLQLVADDSLLLRALMHPTVTNVENSQPLADALLDIFAHAGKVNALLVTLCGMEFDGDSQPQAIFRTDSHLTNFFKAFTTRFGCRYREKRLAKLVAYLRQNGPIDLGDLNAKSKALVFKMLLTSLHTILASARSVPGQFRHLARVLKGVSGYKFNSKQAVFNALSGFFNLRFVNAQIATWVDPAELGFQSQFLAQFSQLLQPPLSLLAYGGSDDTFVEWNPYLIAHVFPELTNFTLSLAEAEEMPAYRVPNQQVLQDAIGVVLEAMENNRDLSARYCELAGDTQECPPITWVLGSFLMSFFKDTIADDSTEGEQ